MTALKKKSPGVEKAGSHNKELWLCDDAKHQLKPRSKLCMKEKAYVVHIWSYHLSSATPPNSSLKQIFLAKKTF